MTPMTIVADDYGMGAETSRGILELACSGAITATVMIVNCADAPRAVAAWKEARPEADLGWHPNLTLDTPLCPPEQVPTLVQENGLFYPLGAFLKRVCQGRIAREDILREWRAQFARFIELVGNPPPVINSHQHVSLFPPADQALFQILHEYNYRPYLRRVTESLGPLCRVKGARIKRTILSLLGHRVARKAASHGLPGCRQLMGVTDPKYLQRENFWINWVCALNRKVSVEICCHPGYSDTTLIGRDFEEPSGVERRLHEMEQLRDPMFREIVTKSGFAVVRPTRFATDFV